MKSDILPKASPPSSPLNQYAGCKLPAVSRCGSSSSPTRSPLHNTPMVFCLVRTSLMGKNIFFSTMIIYPPQLQPEMYPVLLFNQNSHK